MADTDIETLPNGTANLTEEEEERLKQRPADIDADVREMERRKRVEVLMSSKLFREELERVLDQQMSEGGDAPLLQRLREMVGGRMHSGSLRGPTCVLPINDIRGIEGVGYEKGEKILRCKLAAVYRLVDLFGWTQTGVNGQITARLNTAVEQVLTTPRGLLPHEVTASSLVKVDMQGAVQDQGTTNFPVNVEGFSVHAAVHAARPDLRCALHVRSGAALAVSAARRGLLPLCREAAALGDCPTHRLPEGILDNEERDKLVRALGPHSKVLIITNGGALCMGATLEEAFHHARLLTTAAEVQLRVASIPVQELDLIDEDTRRQIYEATHSPPADASKWRVGGEEFEALMRMLDNAGFRTGYIYRHPLIKNDVPKPKNDVEVPPAVSSLGYLLEEEELYKQGLWKKGQGKTGERTRWLNSPNVYQKVEVLETGTNDPKKITKWVEANNEEWVQDGSPAHSSTPVKIDTLQFVPKNTNPKEFKKLQQQIKDNRRADKISAGPQSHILEGVTWDEAGKFVAEDAVNTHTGDHVVLMGAASKGIIQRGYQHNATMYSAPYARNPFDHVTDTEIEDYRRAVERKGRGEYDTDLSESEAISAAQITSPASAPSETEEESRDEHRVLRIETMQAPVRSQPEVVLSDVDTTDFLNAERAHADKTKDTRDPTKFSDDDVFAPSAVKTGVASVITARAHHRVGRDPNLLSDDEVFLDSAASNVTSSVTSRMTSLPPAVVVIRAQLAAVTRTARGTNGTNTSQAALTANKRILHDYTRNPNFENIMKVYESPEKVKDKTHPKCKVSLNMPLNDNAEPLASSRSSLYSIPSIEWDGRAKSEYALKTRSLPRQRVQNPPRLYRTQSHSGFINSYIKNPVQNHYHLPRCRSCGITNSYFAWELAKDEKQKSTSIYCSVDNIPQSCEELTVKVKEKVVPVFNVEKVEFVESQEFNEDNYLEDLGNSFSSDNKTVIEKDNVVNKFDAAASKEKEGKETQTEDIYGDENVYRAEVAKVEQADTDATLETSEGEYHSFTDDFEEAYESPVKDLVEKDIRDYSVPINFYCDDYMKKNDGSPKTTPQKGREMPNTVLEPILEESKSSYGDDSGNISNNGSKESDAKSITEQVVEDVITEALSTASIREANYEDVLLDSDQVPNKCDEPNTAIGVSTNDKQDYEVFVAEKQEVPPIPILKKAEFKIPTVCPRKSSSENSIASSTLEIVTLDSTTEFEKHEVISEILIMLLNKIDYENDVNSFYLKVHERTTVVLKECFDDSSNIILESENKILNNKGEINQDCTEHISISEKNEVIPKGIIEQENESSENTDNQQSHVHLIKDELDTQKNTEIISTQSNVVEIDNLTFKDENIAEEYNNNMDTENNKSEIFSITKMVHDMASNMNLNDTGHTECSEITNEAFKIVESVVYFLFDRAFFVSKNKNKKKVCKSVVTVVDPEDIVYTTKLLWYDDGSNQRANEHTNASINSLQVVNNAEDNTEVLVKENDQLELKAKLGENRNPISEMNVSSNEAFRVDNDMDLLTRIAEYASAETDRENNFIHPLDLALIENINDNEEDVNNNILDIENPSVIALSNYVSVRTDAEINMSDCSSTDDEECKDLSDNSIEMAEDIVYKIFNRIPYASNEKNELNEYFDYTTKHFEDTYISHLNDNDTMEVDLSEFVSELNDSEHITSTDLYQSSESKPETSENVLTESNKVSTTYGENALNETFTEDNTSIEQNPDDTEPDRMNTAFVQDIHTCSSPEKGCKAFESCTESPIRKPNNSFLGQDLTVTYGNDTVLGSPFVKRASVISMSQTEKIGGIKYWLSFDDSVQDNSFNANDSIARRFKRIDETVPSFYGIDIGRESRNDFTERQSVLVDNGIKTGIDFEKDDIKEVDPNEEVLHITSPSSSKFNTCESFELDTPQKMFIYEVHKRKNLYSTWPPFEHTLFYRIISKFRMSESFDACDLESASINSF